MPRSYEAPEARRYHASCLIGHEQFVIGGVNSSDQALSDSWHFNLVRKNWKKLNTKYDSYFEGGVYGHSIHLMKKRGTKFSDPYHKADVEDTHISLNDKDKLNIEVFMEGILIFGGFNSQTKQPTESYFCIWGVTQSHFQKYFQKESHLLQEGIITWFILSIWGIW